MSGFGAFSPDGTKGSDDLKLAEGIVKDNKYYLFLYNIELDAQQLWLDKKDHSGLVAKANQNWNKLKK